MYEGLLNNHETGFDIFSEISIRLAKMLLLCQNVTHADKVLTTVRTRLAEGKETLQNFVLVKLHLAEGKLNYGLNRYEAAMHSFQ